MKFNIVATSDHYQTSNPLHGTDITVKLEYTAKPVDSWLRGKLTKVYSIEISRIEDLIDIIKKTGHDLVIREETDLRLDQEAYDKKPLPYDFTIEIYDDWRE